MTKQNNTQSHINKEQSHMQITWQMGTGRSNKIEVFRSHRKKRTMRSIIESCDMLYNCAHPCFWGESSMKQLVALVGSLPPKDPGGPGRALG